MKRFWMHPAAKIVLLVALWFVAIRTVSYVVVSRLGYSPQYPYYNEIRTHLNKLDAVFASFDGIHYLHIARGWYNGTGEQAFFPLYPGVVRGLGQFHMEPEVTAGIINAMGLFAGLFGLYLLYGKKAWFPIVATLVFPTSFFFAGIYTESLFFGLSVLFFLSLRRKHFATAAIFAGLASATRLVGCLLGLALALELLRSRKFLSSRISLLSTPLLLFISESGLFYYMYYLWAKFGDPLMFIHVQSMFGAERTSGAVVLLPQVLVRYAKMIVTVNPHTWVYTRIWLELIVFLGAIIVWVRRYRNINLSLSVYIVGSLLLPTLTGTLSSMPRYTLVLVPWLVGAGEISIKWRVCLIVSLALAAYILVVFSEGMFVA